MIADFLTAFIPIFVAMDALGVLPLYLGLVDKLEDHEKRSVLFQAVVTAALVGMIFVPLGKAVFQFLGITVADFQVAGGIILLILAIVDLLFPDKARRNPVDMVGVVPIGIPLIVGPAVLTALIVQVDHVGMIATGMAFFANLVFATIVFSSSKGIYRLIGKAGVQGFSKVANLLLAAIGVMIIRKGLQAILGTF